MLEVGYCATWNIPNDYLVIFTTCYPHFWRVKIEDKYTHGLKCKYMKTLEYKNPSTTPYQETFDLISNK